MPTTAWPHLAVSIGGTDCIDFSRLYSFISIDNHFHKINGGNVDCGKTPVDSFHAVHESVSWRRPWVLVHAVHGKIHLCECLCRCWSSQTMIQASGMALATPVNCPFSGRICRQRRPGLTDPSHSASSSRSNSRKTYTQHRSSASTNANMSALDLWCTSHWRRVVRQVPPEARESLLDDSWMSLYIGGCWRAVILSIELHQIESITKRGKNRKN
jgi:hypothetical protein